MEKLTTDIPETGVEGKNEILAMNLNTLIELYQFDERGGKYEESADIANAVERTIQKHTTGAERGYNKISDGEAFLADLHASRERLLSGARDDSEKAKINEIFGRVDIV